jgi:hypothetical protein
MPKVIKPSWEVFDQLVAVAKTELILCAPWISSVGLQRLSNLLLNASQATPRTRVQLWARVADINTDSPGMLELARKLAAAGISTVIRDSLGLKERPVDVMLTLFTAMGVVRCVRLRPGASGRILRLSKTARSGFADSTFGGRTSTQPGEEVQVTKRRRQQVRCVKPITIAVNGGRVAGGAPE